MTETCTDCGNRPWLSDRVPAECLTCSRFPGGSGDQDNFRPIDSSSIRELRVGLGSDERDAIRKERNFSTKFLSASALKDYFGCKRRFYYKKVLGLSRPPTMPLIQGHMVHGYLEEWERLDRPEYTTEEIALLMWHMYDSDGEKTLYDKDDPEEVVKQSVDMVQGFQPRYKPRQDPQPWLEVYFCVPIGNTGWHVQGFLDKVSNDLVIVDYKTSSRNWSAFRENAELQSYIYPYALKLCMALDFMPSMVYSLLMKHKNIKENSFRVVTSKVRDDNITYFWDNVLPMVVADIERRGTVEHNWLPEPSDDWIRFCEHRDRCPIQPDIVEND